MRAVRTAARPDATSIHAEAVPSLTIEVKTAPRKITHRGARNGWKLAERSRVDVALCTASKESRCIADIAAGEDQLRRHDIMNHAPPKLLLRCRRAVVKLSRLQGELF